MKCIARWGYTTKSTLPKELSFRQDFRLANHWKGYLTGGSFSNDRQGLAAGIGYFSANGRWTVEGGGGITGSAHFYGSEWKMSKWKRVNGQISVKEFRVLHNRHK